MMMKPCSYYLFILVAVLLLSCTETTDRDALLALKTRIISDTVLANNWSAHSSVCDWIGVSCCIKHPRVTALNFSGFGFGGSLVPNLGNLTFLRSLDLSNNSFTGSLPGELSNLRRLKVINMGSNWLTGEIPSWLGTLGELERIILSNNSFSGSIPPSLGNNTKLRVVRLGSNSVSGSIPHEIGNVSSLQILDLSYNDQIRGSIPDNIFNLSGIEAIHVTGNNISGRLPAESICPDINSKLRGLYLSLNQLSGQIPFDIYKCSQLRDLSLSYNQFSGNIPPSIARLTNLQQMYLGDNNFQGELPAELGNLNLVKFSVSNSNLSGAIPPSIFNISTIESMTLAMNHFSGQLPSTMGLSLPNLKELFLSGNRLSGPIPSSISNASALTILEMPGNFFTGSIPNFGDLRFLRVLSLGWNDLTGNSPNQELTFLSSLTNCRDLHIIYFSKNKLDGILPTSIGNFSSTLRIFYASGSRIRGSIPVEIGNLTNLPDLDLSSNELTGPIPATLGKLNQLERIHLEHNKLEGHLPGDLCHLSRLGEFSVSDNMLHGPIPECIGELKSLRRLYLDSNKLESNVPSRLWDLNDLLALNLSTNILSGPLPAEIGNFRVLEELDLSWNQFSGNIPTSISIVESLVNLSLAHNKFQGSIPDQSIGNLKSLVSLDLSYNNLSGFIPKSLEGLRYLHYFNVSYNRLEGLIPTGVNFANFTAQSFLKNYGLCGAARLQFPPCGESHKKTRSKNAVTLLKYILPPCLSAITVVVVILLLINRRKSKAQPPNGELLLLPSWRASSYLELQRATNTFSETNLLGSGSFGSAYIGTLSDGLTVAVKVFSLLAERVARSFDTETEVLRGIRHRNLIKIIGCCISADFKALVYEYMPNGSLETWLHAHNCFLDLLQRLNIAIDVALALEYLHVGLTSPIVHCDIKPSNILLDGDMTARVGDLGIAKIVGEEELMTRTKTLATIGYMAPEYGSEGIISTGGDVYSFGIILLEICTRKKPTDEMFGEEMSLKKWVRLSLHENTIIKIVDTNLIDEEDNNFWAKEQCLSSILSLAMKCVGILPADRIKISEVVAELKKIKICLQQTMRIQ